MVEKYDSIVALAVEHALALAAKPETYLSFLTTAANNFKYTFEEQLSYEIGRASCRERV